MRHGEYKVCEFFADTIEAIIFINYLDQSLSASLKV